MSTKELAGELLQIALDDLKISPIHSSFSDDEERFLEDAQDEIAATLADICERFGV